jgi:chaperonin cofactor prefoldin
VKTQTNLLKSIDRLTNQVADLTTQNRMISERIAELAQALPSRD